MSNALPLATAFLVVGFTRVGLPLFGGTLVPSLDLVLPRTIDAAGNDSLTIIWPSGMPSGFSAYWQTWLVDPAGPQGAAASNAVLCLVP